MGEGTIGQLSRNRVDEVKAMGDSSPQLAKAFQIGVAKGAVVSDDHLQVVPGRVRYLAHGDPVPAGDQIRDLVQIEAGPHGRDVEAIQHGSPAGSHRLDVRFLRGLHHVTVGLPSEKDVHENSLRSGPQLLILSTRCGNVLAD